MAVAFDPKKMPKQVDNNKLQKRGFLKLEISSFECKCPSCGEKYFLADAMGEQLINKLREELAVENDAATRVILETEIRKALDEGKSIANREFMTRFEEKQSELETVKANLMQMHLSKIEKDAEVERLKESNELAISMRLAREQSIWTAEKTTLESGLKLQIEQLKNDLQRASARVQQGSMQSQGEASEIAIEETLKEFFGSDEIIEIRKGHKGADCILQVKNHIGRPVGKIVIESKNTKVFSSEWVKKLKTDVISENAHIGIIVTNAFPANESKAHIRDGIWICGFHEYLLLIQALRQSIFELARAHATEIARDEKAQVMYDFLTSKQFAQTIEQMISPIFRMHEQLQKEKRSMTKLWKEREALIECSINGTENLYMKIQGIAQINLPSISGMTSIDCLVSEETEG
jgi:hypothetical protein